MDVQQQLGSSLINQSTSNILPKFDLNCNNKSIHSHINTDTNKDSLINVTNDTSVNNNNKYDSPYNNDSNDMNDTTNPDSNPCNNHNMSIHTCPYTPSHVPFLNEYNHELFQPIRHREVVSGFSWLHTNKATNTTAYVSNRMINRITAPEQEVRPGAPAPCMDPAQPHAPDPTPAVPTSKSKSIPTPNPNPNPQVKPTEDPKIIPTPIPTPNPTPAMPPPQVSSSNTPHTTPTNTSAPHSIHPLPSQCHLPPNSNHPTSLPPLPPHHNTPTTQYPPHSTLTNVSYKSPSLSKSPSPKKFRPNPPGAALATGLPQAHDAAQGDPNSTPYTPVHSLTTPDKYHTPPPPPHLPLRPPPTPHPRHTPTPIPNLPHPTPCLLTQPRITTLHMHTNPNPTAQDAHHLPSTQSQHPTTFTHFTDNNKHPAPSLHTSHNCHDPYIDPHHLPATCPSS
jgi:hypothetical protein